MQPQRSPLARGVLLALLAALTFGITVPLVERAGKGVGPFATAALLYLGAAGSALAIGVVAPASGAPLRRPQFGRVVWVALFGAGIAPTLLAWGLQRTGGANASLLLNLEAAFTVLFAWLIHREPVGARVLVALTLMACGGAVLALGAASVATWTLAGTLAVIGATVAWALDNTLTRVLADHDPVAVVAAKGIVGGTLTTVAALLAREPLPAPGAALALLACGATGYGVSLRLYLLAQRRVGAARTGSTFALAPFVGAALSWVLGDRELGPWTWLAAALFGMGVWLHVTERHAHRHVHPAVEHEHAHRHDDGHHDHVHDPPVVGEHTHRHRHDLVEHEHEHAPDVHHDHAHG